MSNRDINELLKDAIIDFTNKPPLAVCKRLSRIKDEAVLAKRRNDYKKALIYSKRWLNIAEWIKTTRQYKADRSYYDKNFSIDKEDEVKALFAQVEKEYIASTIPKKFEPDIEDAPMVETRIKAQNSSMEGILNLPETPTDEPLAKESEEFTTCLQLFQFLKSDTRTLIIDVRPKKDFQESKIKTNRCINIPAEKIKSGVLAHSYETLFKDDSESLYFYERRGNNMTDIIVLLDWRTTSSTLFPDNKMCVLRDILKDWDPGKKVTKIAILDGGFSDWLNHYPSLVTNPKVKTPDLPTNAMDEILEEVRYAEWIVDDDNASSFDQLRIQQPLEENDAKKTMTNKSSLSPNVRNDSMKSLKNENDRIHVTRDPYKFVNEKMSEMTRYDRRKIENRHTEDMSVDEDEIIFETKLPNDSTFLPSVTKPRIDRGSKPSSSSTVKKSSTGGMQLLTLKNQLVDLLKNLELAESEILSIEQARCAQDENDNGDKSEKWNQADLRDRLKLLNLSVAKLTNKKDEVKEALLKQSMKNVFLNPTDENKKSQIDLSISRFEQRLKAISLERETLKRKAIEKKTAKMNTLAPRLNENGIAREPLKSDGSSANTGLKRSHSSPNLAQVENGKVPLVDRSSKPRVSMTQTPYRGTASANSKLTWKDRERRMEPIFRDTRPGITGLKNLGNSCYMNSIIQCLSNNIRLAKYFNEDAYLDDLNKSRNICKQGQVADEVAHVIKALWRGQYKSISPRDLKVVIGQYRLQFNCTEQQDSHEFLVFLLDWLHDDLKKGVDYYSDNVSIARKQWFKSLGNGESIISELFMGQLKSSIICTTCNNSSITYETFNSLTLSLPNTNRCTLDDCIKKFVTGQKVSGWTCDNCKAPRDATKKFDFIKLPPTVTIHLNRFADNEGWLQKSNTCVDFPLADLNLGTYLVDEDDNSDDTKNPYDFYKMSLYAMSVHYGTMSGGHYTAYCRNGGQHKWYKYDDQLVSEVQPSEVKNQGNTAYLLFYTTIGSVSYPYIQRNPLMKLARL